MEQESVIPYQSGTMEGTVYSEFYPDLRVLSMMAEVTTKFTFQTIYLNFLQKIHIQTKKRLQNKK
jgi:hypothetical protein